MKFSEPEELDPFYKAFVKLGIWGEQEEERLRNIIEDTLIYTPPKKWHNLQLKDAYSLIAFYQRLQSLDSREDVRQAFMMRSRMHEHLKYSLIPNKISNLLIKTYEKFNENK